MSSHQAFFQALITKKKELFCAQKSVQADKFQTAKKGEFDKHLFKGLFVKSTTMYTFSTH